MPFLLRELALEPDGRALTPWFAQKKNGRLYRYDLPTREKKEHAGAWAGRFIRLHLLETFIPWTLVKRGVKREVIIYWMRRRRSGRRLPPSGKPGRRQKTRRSSGR